MSRIQASQSRLWSSVTKMSRVMSCLPRGVDACRRQGGREGRRQDGEARVQRCQKKARAGTHCTVTHTVNTARRLREEGTSASMIAVISCSSMLTRLIVPSDVSPRRSVIEVVTCVVAYISFQVIFHVTDDWTYQVARVPDA
jgi:hypothetical protein